MVVVVRVAVVFVLMIVVDVLVVDVGLLVGRESVVVCTVDVVG